MDGANDDIVPLFWQCQHQVIESTSKESRKYTPDELELIVSESHEGGLLAEQEHELVENIFDFSERRVVEVMIRGDYILANPGERTGACFQGE